MTITHASLFSGIGGPEIAAEMLGWENLFHCEINPFGRAVLNYWYPNAESYEDITKTDFRPWRGKVRVLTGGFPCQPFSYAGKRGGREDERYLWPQMLRAIDEIRPAWVVGENVAGIATMVEGGVCTEMGGGPTLFGEGDGLQEYEARQRFTIERVCRDLERLGYSVQPMLIPAAAVGAPHRRDRVFILAYASDPHGGNDLRKPGADAGQGGEEGLQERDKVREPGEPDQLRPEGPGYAIPHPVRQGLEGQNQPRPGKGKQRLRLRGNLTRCNWQSDGDWWRDFPTISPIHRGNDGLPFDVDNLTLPFAKWRTESLKAYGNAIVPQVMYEIFKMIDKIEYEHLH